MAAALHLVRKDVMMMIIGSKKKMQAKEQSDGKKAKVDEME